MYKKKKKNNSFYAHYIIYTAGFMTTTCTLSSTTSATKSKVLFTYIDSLVNRDEESVLSSNPEHVKEIQSFDTFLKFPVIY